MRTFALALTACQSGPPKCDSPQTTAALQDLFQTQIGKIFFHYVYNSYDPLRTLALQQKLNFGLLNGEIQFDQAIAQSLKWSFQVKGVVTASTDVSTCIGTATFQNTAAKDSFNFNFQARATDDGGVLVTLTE